MNHKPTPLRIVIIYVIAAAAWIILSDRWLAGLPGAMASITWLQTLKGWFFVAGTGLLLYILVKHSFNVLEASQRELQHRVAELRAIFQAAPLAIVALDPQANVTVWNPAAERMFGWRADEALGRPPRFIDMNSESEFRAVLQRVLNGESLAGLEVHRRKADGSSVYVSISTAPLLATDDSTTGVMAVIADVTEAKRMQEALRQSQKMEGMGLLAGSVAHDFNNLLTVIQGNAELALDELTPADDLYKDISLIHATSLRAAGLAKQLLAFSRRRTDQAQWLNLNGTTDEFIRLLGRLLGKDVNVRLDLTPDLPPIFADPGALEQILLNLSLNARDAMPHGGTLTISTAAVTLEEDDCREHPECEPGPYVRLSVADTGTGMDENVRRHLFEPFFTTKEPGKGTGLGLSVVQSVVKQHGGFIDVWSQLEAGTKFDIYLPRGKEHGT